MKTKKANEQNGQGRLSEEGWIKIDQRSETFKLLDKPSISTIALENYWAVPTKDVLALCLTNSTPNRNVYRWTPKDKPWNVYIYKASKLKTTEIPIHGDFAK